MSRSYGAAERDKPLVIPPPGKVAGGDQHRMLCVGIAAGEDRLQVVGMGSVDLPLVQSRHPHAELLEQFVSATAPGTRPGPLVPR